MAEPICAHCGANVLTSNWPDCCKRYGEQPFVSWRLDFIVVSDLVPCAICKIPTRFIQLDFECHLHPGACDQQMWAAYGAALHRVP